MIPYKEIKPFLISLAWKGIKEFGLIMFGITGLVWLAGWIVVAPVQFFVMWMTDEVPLWGMLIAVVFWVVPALFLGFVELEKAWEKHLLRKGYTKS